MQQPTPLIIGAIIVVFLIFSGRDAIAQKGAQWTLNDAKRGRSVRNLLFGAVALVILFVVSTQSQTGRSKQRHQTGEEVIREAFGDHAVPDSKRKKTPDEIARELLGEPINSPKPKTEPTPARPLTPEQRERLKGFGALLNANTNA